MINAKLIYSAIIKSVITYASIVWRTPKNGAKHAKNIDNKLNVIQNKCCKTITKTYKATSIKVFEIEASMKPFFIHMNKLQVKYKIKLTIEQHVKSMTKNGERIQRKLKKVKGLQRIVETTPGKIKQKWIRKTIPKNLTIRKKSA